MNEQPTAAQISKSRRGLLLLAALFFGPIIVSWLFIRFGSEYIEVVPQSYGVLVSPPVSLQPFQIADEGFNLADMQGVWSLVYPLTGPCDEQCAKVIYNTRQVRTALAKEMTRLQRVVLWQTEIADATLPLDDPQRHPALKVLRGDSAQLAPLWSQLPENREQGLFLVDPMGSLMMRYPLDFEGKALLKELRFLLKNSVLG